MSRPMKPTLGRRLCTLGVALLCCMGQLAHADALPKILKKVPPEFPESARAKQIATGSVRAKLVIEPDGKVAEVIILESQPTKVFDQAAIQALSRWRFEAGAKQVSAEIKIVFQDD